jgi:ubiquitin-conjugating enzyme E2 D/E
LHMALRRIQKELRDIQKDPPSFVLSCAPVQQEQGVGGKAASTAGSPAASSAGKKEGSEFFVWKAVILGPDGTAYSDGHFTAILTFPSDYPFKPPRMQIATRVFHPNVNQNGGACLDILKDGWSPALTASRVLGAFVDLLERPVLDDPLRPDVAVMYRRDYAAFYRRAREMTEAYALPASQVGAAGAPLGVGMGSSAAGSIRGGGQTAASASSKFQAAAVVGTATTGGAVSPVSAVSQMDESPEGSDEAFSGATRATVSFSCVGDAAPL